MKAKDKKMGLRVVMLQALYIYESVTVVQFRKVEKISKVIADHKRKKLNDREQLAGWSKSVVLTGAL